MSIGAVMPSPVFTAFSATGPYPGALLNAYVSGSATRLNTYSDSALTTPNANPVVCDSAGRAIVYLIGGRAYKFVLTTPAGAVIWTVDPVYGLVVAGTNVDVSGLAAEALAANDAVFLSDGSGGLSAGQWYRMNATTVTKSTLPRVIGFATAAIASGAVGLIRLSGTLSGFAGLTTGATYYAASVAGAITAVAPTNARVVGVADSATDLVIYSQPVSDILSGQAVHVFGGSYGDRAYQVAYPVGATADFLSINTGIFPLDSALLAAGTYHLRAMVRSENALATATLALVNLTDASETALVTCATTNTLGALVTSGAITFAAAGTSKNYGVKIMTSNALYGADAWSIELVRA